MNAREWFSERSKRMVDLNKLSKEELIAELFAERKGYLEIEDSLKIESEVEGEQ